MATLHVFTDVERALANILLCTKVATMMGRKLEEGDWSQVYCGAKSIESKGWSNLNIDLMHGSLGLEQKALCVKSREDIREYCGTTQMHPSATRSIRIPNQRNPTKAARDILAQYALLIEERSTKVSENANGAAPDMRTGWLLWEATLRQFLYFEERMTPPVPENYTAIWKERDSREGGRKGSKNLWVYETATGKKRFSITTSAGAKIQPYFDVPVPSDPNLYIFTAQGEMTDGGLVRIWVTKATASLLKASLGSLDGEKLSQAILEAAKNMPKESSVIATAEDQAIELLISVEAYDSLKVGFAGVSDEHMIQLVVKYLAGK